MAKRGRGPIAHTDRVHTDYSKPSADIRTESLERLFGERAAFARQERALKETRTRQKRRVCIVCGRPLHGEFLRHRGLAFVLCSRCGHLQSSKRLARRDARFDVIYPRLSARAYRERRQRIYTPKLEWIVRVLRRLGYSRRRLQSLRWMEIGAGAGYFLSALDEFGVKRFGGFDSNRELVAVANRALGSKRVQHESDPDLAAALHRYPADVYVAFFVFEHVDNMRAVLRSFDALPPGTVLIFSVPVFGFSVLLDGAFPNRFARQLDGVVHQQLYTDRSIQHAMKTAGFTIEAEWIFGQDADDLSRYLLQSLAGRCSTRWWRALSAQMLGVQDSIQQALDYARLADQRHIIAVKR